MSYPNFEKLVEVIQALRHPDTGCPWDLEQTHKSLLRFLIEESYEFVHATELENDESMEDEMGDVLLQVLLHCQLGHERGAFDIESVSKVLSDKMIRRHPHVFENPTGKKFTHEEIKSAWQTIKKNENAKNPNKTSTLIDDSNLAFPALFSSNEIGKATAKISFDWDEPSQVLYKVEEEWQELKEELAPGVVPNQKRVKEELGDFLFTIAQLGRHLGIDPEEALRDANTKFLKRFHSMEGLINESGKDILQMNQSQMDEYWHKVKLLEKK